MMASVLLMALVASAKSDVNDVNPDVMSLVLMEDFADEEGAVCLDGSPGGFYYRPATNPQHAHDWILHFKGAGWCYDERDCLARSEMEFGSSTFWSNTTNGWSGGILSPNDPNFGEFNKVVLLYCDGASFTGDRTKPVEVQGADGKSRPLYFRGFRIMNAIIETLIRDYELNKAENVLLTGCSSGGLAAYLHSDYLHGRIKAVSPELKKFRTAPVSGFFLYHDNVNGASVYPTEMKQVFDMSNSTGGVPSACVSAMGLENAWKCVFAQNAYAHSTTPTFVVNSAYDMWQSWCIFGSNLVDGFPNQKGGNNGNCSSIDGWTQCSRNPENCSSSQVQKMNGYISDFVSALHATPAFNDGNGAFVTSCFEHCEGLAAGWSMYKNNGVSMRDATGSWWNGTSTSSKSTTYLPCQFKTTSPHKCNPTCPNVSNTALFTI